MPLSVAQQLVRYRNVLVALANAGITWIVLIIAPLGLFAVILCTVLVFIGSLLTGFIGDLALNSLLEEGNREMMRLFERQNLDVDSSDFNPDIQPQNPSRSFPKPKSQRNLPRE